MKSALPCHGGADFLYKKIMGGFMQKALEMPQQNVIKFLYMNKILYSR